MVHIVLWLVLANSLHDFSDSWRFNTASVSLSAGSAQLCCSSLDPSGIRSARNERIKDFSQKPAEVSGGQGDFCFWACSLVPVSHSCPPPTSALISSPSCKQEARLYSVMGPVLLYLSVLFTTLSPSHFVKHAWLNKSEPKTNNPNAWFVPGVQVSVFLQMLTCRKLLPDPRALQEQRVALSLCGDELQGVTIVFECVYFTWVRESGSSSHALVTRHPEVLIQKLQHLMVFLCSL